MSRLSHTWSLRIHAAAKILRQKSYPLASLSPSTVDLAGEQLGEAELGADQHEERAQGDDEAGQLGLLDDRAVEPADRQGEGQRQRHGDVERRARRRRWSPTSLDSRITSIAVAPVIAPDDRSNSPPIISSETATAMMPETGRDVEVVGRSGGGPERLGNRPEEHPHGRGADRARRSPGARGQRWIGPRNAEPLVDGRRPAGSCLPSTL